MLLGKRLWVFALHLSLYGVSRGGPARPCWLVDVPRANYTCVCMRILRMSNQQSGIFYFRTSLTPSDERMYDVKMSSV